MPVSAVNSDYMKEISQSIGGLQEAVKNLTATTVRFEDRHQRDHDAMSEKVDGIREDVISLTGRVDNLSDSVNGVIPSVRKFEEAQFRSAGAKNFGRLVWGVVISVLTVTVAGLSQIIQFVKAGP